MHKGSHNNSFADEFDSHLFNHASPSTIDKSVNGSRKFKLIDSNITTPAMSRDKSVDRVFIKNDADKSEGSI